MRNLLQYISLRHLTTKRLRSALTVLGVALGIALFVAISIINHSTRNSFKENVQAISGKAKITISAGPTGFSEEKLERVKGTPGVRHAVPLVEQQAFLKGAADTSESLLILGVDLLQEQAVRTYETTEQDIVDDPLVFLNQPDSIVITEALAQSRGLKIDSKISLATASGEKVFTVRGLLRPEGAARAYGGSLAIMDIDGARFTFGREGKLDRIDIVPEEGQDLDQLISSLKEVVGSGFSVQSPETEVASSEKMVASYQRMLTFFSTLALLVGLFMVFNAVSISVAERKKEIGTLRALGATRRGLISIFVGESLMMGFLGALIGTGIGRLLSEKLVDQVSAALASQYQTRVQVTQLEFLPRDFLIALVVGTLTSGFAALIPAFRASRTSPIEAMKSHGMENFSREKVSPLPWISGLALYVFVYFSTVNQWSRIWSGIDEITQGASVIGAALLGPVLVVSVIRRFGPGIRKTQSPVLRLAHDNLLKSRRRTAGNIMSLMVGLYLVVLIATVRTSFTFTLMSWLSDAFTADILVSASGRLITAEVQPVEERILPEVLAAPGVRQPEPGAGTRSRILRFRSDGRSYTIKAFDRPSSWTGYRMFPVTRSERAKTALSLYESEEPRTLVSENFFLKNPQLKVGEFVELDTPSGRTAFKIMGTVMDYASAEGVFYLNRAVYQKLWRDSQVTGFAVYLEPGQDLETVRKEIDRRVGQKYGLVAFSNAEVRAQMGEAIDRSMAYTRAIELASLLVALLGLLNTLLISVMERTREIGILRAMGTTRRQIFRLILSESVIQGVFGALIAVAFGAWIGKIWIENSLAYSLGWIVTYDFPFSTVLLAVGVGTFVALLAGIYPARKAASLPITEALDYE